MYKRLSVSQTRQDISVTMFNRLMLFREIIPPSCENHMKRINTLGGQSLEFLDDRTRGAYLYITPQFVESSNVYISPILAIISAWPILAF
jgi:hypothetical protein